MLLIRLLASLMVFRRPLVADVELVLFASSIRDWWYGLRWWYELLSFCSFCSIFESKHENNGLSNGPTKRLVRTNRVLEIFMNSMATRLKRKTKRRMFLFFYVGFEWKENLFLKFKITVALALFNSKEKESHVVGWAREKRRHTCCFISCCLSDALEMRVAGVVNVSCSWISKWLRRWDGVLFWQSLVYELILLLRKKNENIWDRQNEKRFTLCFV